MGGTANGSAGSVLKAVAPAAGLGALAAVAAAAADGIAHETLAAVAHAQSAMHEAFKLNLRVRPYGTNVLQAQFAGKDDAGEADLFKERNLPGCGIVHLRAGKQGQGRKINLKQTRVLYDEGINADSVQLPDEALRIFKLGIG
jgi:hypothetical protein